MELFSDIVHLIYQNVIFVDIVDHVPALFLLRMQILSYLITLQPTLVKIFVIFLWKICLLDEFGWVVYVHDELQVRICQRYEVQDSIAF